MSVTGHKWKYSSNTLPCISQVLNESENNTDADADALQQLEEIESGVGHLDHHDHRHLSSDGFFCSSPSEMNVWLKTLIQSYPLILNIFNFWVVRFACVISIQNDCILFYYFISFCKCSLCELIYMRMVHVLYDTF